MKVAFFRTIMSALKNFITMFDKYKQNVFYGNLLKLVSIALKLNSWPLNASVSSSSDKFSDVVLILLSAGNN